VVFRLGHQKRFRVKSISLFSLLQALILLCSCSHFPLKSEVTVTQPENARMQFSGKGAGAGMMLMSSMGPMGVAIGVAIDEGIAKNIGETAEAGGVNVQKIVKLAFSGAAKQANQPLRIRVLEYGFVTTAADEKFSDPVVAKLKLAVGSRNSEIMNLLIYADASASECMLSKHELSDVKSSASVIEASFMSAAECGYALWRSRFKPEQTLEP